MSKECIFCKPRVICEFCKSTNIKPYSGSFPPSSSRFVKCEDCGTVQLNE